MAQFFAGTTKTSDDFFSSKIVSAFRIRYNFSPGISIILGAENMFNVYPDKIKDTDNTNNGIFIYSSNVTQFGYNGGYYFLNMVFNWWG